MLSKTYDALLAAGAPEDKASEAGEKIAAYENRLCDPRRRSLLKLLQQAPDHDARIIIEEACRRSPGSISARLCGIVAQTAPVRIAPFDISRHAAEALS
jgi:hypothetical protein